MGKILFGILSVLFCLIAISSCSTDDDILDKQALGENSRISVRINNGFNEFYNTNTLTKFEMRGYNYTHVQEYEWNNVTLVGHTTFNQSHYNPSSSQELFFKLSNANFNTVRVFLNPFSISKQVDTLDKQYIQNLAHFIKTADEYDISVIITLDSIPVSYYNTELQSEDDIWWWNDQYINTELIDLEIIFWQSFISQLKDNFVPLEAILAYQIRNEFYFHPEHEPFIKPIIIEHKNGNNYNTAMESDKAALIETSFLYWSSEIRNAIRAVDEGALVTVGFYAPEPLSKSSITAIVNSELDFVDLHLYPQTAALTEYDEYFNLLGNKQKLIIMGEFGIIGDEGYNSEEVKNILLSWKENAITVFHIDGWLLWTWNTDQGSELSFPDDDNLIFEALAQ